MTDSHELRLLAAILKGQDDSETNGTLTIFRVRQALTAGPPLTEEERKLIWLSPTARQVFLSVRRQVRADITRRVRAAGLGTAERRLAASGGDTEVIVGNGFVVSIFRDDIPGAEWSVSVSLEPEYLALIGATTNVVLRDGGDHVWASGVPSLQRTISAVWDLIDDPPLRRLQRFDLALEP
jgi:hypothetical protein